MPFNNGLPMNYMNPFQNMLGQAQAQQAMAQAQAAMMQAQQAQQTMTPQQAMPQMAHPTTPPMIHADMIVVSSIDAARKHAVNAGNTQIFCMNDDSAIFVKSVDADGTEEFDVYQKQPPVPAPEYMTREEVMDMLREMNASNGKTAAKEK